MKDRSTINDALAGIAEQLKRIVDAPEKQQAFQGMQDTLNAVLLIHDTIAKGDDSVSLHPERLHPGIRTAGQRALQDIAFSLSHSPLKPEERNSLLAMQNAWAWVLELEGPDHEHLELLGKRGREIRGET